MNLLWKFSRNQSGNVAIIFSIAIVPMLILAGAGVDMIRANNVRTTLQSAADAAALAGGGSDSATTEELTLIALKYLAANGVAESVDALNVSEITNDAETGAFRVRVSGKLKTSFMAVAGLSSMDVEAVSEVKRGASGPMELVLALDTTYSMVENDKIETLKAAATEMVNSVMTSGSVKVGVVPFSDYQQLGMEYAGKSWLNVPNDIHDSYKSCTTTYPDKSGCTTQTTCYSDGVPYSCSVENCTHWGDPEETNCSVVNYVYKFDGCVQSRPQAYHDSIADPDTEKYPGVTWNCGSKIRELTTEKSDVLASIDALYPSGNTYIPSGLIWGWNMLTPEEPLTAAAPMAEVSAKGGKKAMVLMTDGANTMAPHATYGYFSNPYDLGYGSGSDYANGITSSLCEKIKAEGAVLYTVAFDVEDATVETMLQNCATDPAKSFVADDAAQLLQAFKDIGTSLTQLRLTR
jgi:Flp pilus assembly protein TadG